MKPLKTTTSGSPEAPRSSRFLVSLLAAALLVVLAFFAKRAHQYPNPAESTASLPAERTTTSSAPRSLLGTPPSRPHKTVDTPLDAPPTAQEIVANKVLKFAQGRRDLVHALAKRFNVPVPDDVERFFAAVESGRCEAIDAAHQALLADEKNLNQPRSAELHNIWRPIQETWGAAREAHTWPSQTLLDYGNAVLGSLRPSMIYAGGTDPGCFIPTMLNDTTDGERHIVLTQNALADGTYLKYLDVLYGDRMATLTDEDSQRAFQEYVGDAQKRLQHDQQFPNEPKQIKPGEDVKMVEGRIQVSGQVAVMSINEKLFQTLMDKNPAASFAMEESFPFSSMYQNAAPLGPVMEMRVQDDQNTLTAELAAQSVDYWRAAAQQLLSDPDLSADSDPRKAYSKLVASQAGLLEGHKFTAEAEQAYRIACDLCASSPEAVFRYINLLLGQNRIADALPVAEAAVQAAPDNAQCQDLLQKLKVKASEAH